MCVEVALELCKHMRVHTALTNAAVFACLLSVRSTARLSSGQRTALNDVVGTRTEERNGQTYFVYEHTSQVTRTAVLSLLC
jgi:hypothetical protein